MYPNDVLGSRFLTPSTRPKPALKTAMATFSFSISKPSILVKGVSIGFTFVDIFFVPSIKSRYDNLEEYSLKFSKSVSLSRIIVR